MQNELLELAVDAGGTSDSTSSSNEAEVVRYSFSLTGQSASVSANRWGGAFVTSFVVIFKCPAPAASLRSLAAPLAPLVAAWRAQRSLV